MGTINSRPKICKVSPKEKQQFHQHASPRMITAVQHLHHHQHETLEHRRISQLPPLKQHVPQIDPSPPDSQNQNAKPVHSIIKSHPPQKAKTWKPIACPLEPPAATKITDQHVSMRNTGGFLQAQTFLISQAVKKRQSHQRHLRKRRRIYTSSVESAGDVQTERFRLVSRPTQRDIFWDETKGQNLDLRELVQPTPPLADPDFTMGETKRHPKSEVGLKDNAGDSSRDLNESLTKSPERKTQQNLPWLEDFRKHEQKHLSSWDILEGQWEYRQ